MSGSGAGFSTLVIVSPMVMPSTPPRHDVAHGGFGSFGALEAVKRKQLCEWGFLSEPSRLEMVTSSPAWSVPGRRADAMRRSSRSKVEIGDHDLQSAFRVAGSRRNGGDNGLKQWLQVFAGLPGRSVAVPALAPLQHRKLKLRFFGVEIDEQVVNLVQHIPADARRAIDFVDDTMGSSLASSAFAST